MQVNVKNINPKECKDEVLAVAMVQGAKLPFPELTKSIKKEAFEGKLGQTYSVSTLDKFGFKKLVLFGLGENKEFNLDFVRRFAGAGIRYAKALKTASVALALPKTSSSTQETAQALAEGAILANYKCIKFKTKKEDEFDVRNVTILASENTGDAVKRATALANSQNYVRDINESPANIATPQMLAHEAKQLAKQNKLKVTVLEKNDLKKMKMNAVLAVGQGSVVPPVVVVLEYNKGKNLPLYAVVGKGITFDSGGISLKPSKGMQEMKYDKTGAVAVLGIAKAVSELKLPIRLLAVFAATENLPSGSAQKPGDIITAYNGKTIEVLNTDAEGRLILADTLAYVSKQKPKAIIDLATLTGAMVVALGRHRIGCFSNDDKLADTLLKAGEKTYERVWRMPLDKEYSEMIKGDLADVKNISGKGEGGSITAAAFLQEFIGNSKWAHLDIAGVDHIPDSHSYLEKGASGIGVRLVTGTLEKLAKR